MSWQRPTKEDLWRAIGIYLRLAYSQDPPAAVRSRLEALKGAESAFDSSILERDAAAEPSRYALRLGNRLYPHMKFVVERSPDGRAYLLRADTHDRHICPDPASKEYAAFCQLMKSNQELAQAIEAAWEHEQLPTFKAYLREDLARRRK